MKTLLLSAVLAGVLALPGAAGPIEDSIVRQLREQGFSQIDVRRTLLGRSRIVARSTDLYREIVVNPVTGEILRDFWRELGGDGRGTRIVDPSNPGSGQGVDDDRDDDDDDDDDDRDDDDGGDDGDGGDSGDGEGGDDGDDD
ncbi:hypothetical protein [uncultured Tateyamaria sp.]|uniref:hypothetical protein n=1 Tax=uncultured Tateyamaria sp. TaxID=455651 RepID=UPI00261F7354|nr:hypothetical protein [uncultured Tateyamaria sp.]